jgi:hypothetical protein
MGPQWDNQPASRFIEYQNLSWTPSGVAVSTALQKITPTYLNFCRTNVMEWGSIIVHSLSRRERY